MDITLQLGFILGYSVTEWESDMKTDWEEKLRIDNLLADAIKSAEELATIRERMRCAEIARTQFLITPNGKDCGEAIAKKIENV